MGALQPPPPSLERNQRIAGGILEIIAACAVAIMAVLLLVAFGVDGANRYYEYLFLGVLGIVAFGFGLMGGVMALKRIGFVLGMLGACFCVAFGIMGPPLMPSMAAGGNAIFIVILALSALGLIFIGISRREFS